MANVLDEETGPVRAEGREINVIAKQIPVTVGKGSKVFEVLLWFLLIIPGLVFLIMKIKAASYLRQLEQKIQHDASQIDNYLEQRVVILSNLAQLVDKAVKLDKDTFTAIAEECNQRKNRLDRLENQQDFRKLSRLEGAPRNFGRYPAEFLSAKGNHRRKGTV